MGLIERASRAAGILLGINPTNSTSSAPPTARARTVIGDPFMAGQTIWNQDNYAQLSKEGYRNCVIAYRCVNEKSDAFSSVPWTMFRKTAAGRERVMQHPALDLLDRPNPKMGGAAWRAMWAAYFEISGNSFTEAIRVTGGQPTELWLWRPDRVKPEAGKNGALVAYVYADPMNPGNPKKVWPVNQVTLQSNMHQAKKFNPMDDYWGLSPLMAASKAIDTHNAYTTWNKRLLDNAAIPRGVVEVPGNLDDKEFEELKQQFIEEYVGSLNAGKPLILEGGMTWKTVAFTPTEMDWLNGQKTTALDVCRAYGVPGQLLSIEDPTYNNYKEARAAFWENTVNNILTYFRDEMQNWLLPMYGESDLELDYDLREVPAFAERRDASWERAIKSEAFLTVNERRAILDYPETDGGDVILVPWGMQALSPDEPNMGVGIGQAETPMEPSGSAPEAGGEENGEEKEESREKVRFIRMLKEAGWKDKDIDAQVKLAGWASNTAE
jgi:HK97 family phage portal protein